MTSGIRFLEPPAPLDLLEQFTRDRILTDLLTTATGDGRHERSERRWGQPS